MSLRQSLESAISAATGEPFRLERESAVGGGCINAAMVVEGGGRRYFVKTNDPERAAMFEAEAAGLAEIAASRTLRVPLPVCHGHDANFCWLVLEHVEMGRSAAGSARALGEGLAAMHRVTRDRHGWDRDNTIGSTPQPNEPCADWAEFWRERRIGFQLRLAGRRGGVGSLLRRGERLLEALPALLDGHRPPASLLHGDLWGGNHGHDAAGRPVVFDPAVYYGDRETDLAMTELFGGFPATFYETYRVEYPLDPGFPVRKHLYNLYHVLNHFNLFGGGYGAQAEGMMERLLAEAR